MSTSPITLETLQTFIGQPLGESDWRTISQTDIDTFAEATGDHQFIHVDAEKAATTPFGTTIAHGFLTLSLLSVLADGIMPRLTGQKMSINYGFNKIRFANPVPSGSRIKASFQLNDIVQLKPDHYQISTDVTVFIEHQEKPALFANWLSVAVL